MKFWRGLVRAVLALGAVAASLWAVTVFSYATAVGPLVSSAGRVSNGDTYKPEVMRALARTAGDIDPSRCDDRVLVSAATIQARMVEDAIALGELGSVDERLSAVERTANELVRCSPYQGIGWLMLFWSKSVQDGFRPDLIPLLEASYRFAPREAWVAVRRSPVVFSVFQALPAHLQDRAISELIDIASIGQVDRAVEVLTGPAGKYLGRIIPQMERVPLAYRTLISRRLYQAGFDVEMPGLPRQEFRPWR